MSNHPLLDSYAENITGSVIRLGKRLFIAAAGLALP
jgi:hypothetical protein